MNELIRISDSTPVHEFPAKYNDNKTTLETAAKAETATTETAAAETAAAETAATTETAAALEQ